MNPVGNAPISYGAFELTVGVNPYVPDGLGILDRVQAAGYVGVDLGPVGFLGSKATIAANLENRGLGLTGGYLEMPFHSPDGMQTSEGELEDLLEVLDAAAPVNERLNLPRPRPTLAVISQPHRRVRPGQGHSDPSLAYSDEEWSVFATEAERVANLCRERGHPAVFHNETGTNVEAASELATVLELTSFELCLDTGHLIACAGDPVTFLKDWGHRLGQLHVKSAHFERMTDLIAQGEPVEAIWEHRVFCALGEGDLNIADLLNQVKAIGYQGWIVVEQDIFPDETSLDRAVQDQVANRELLLSFGF